ncbi:NADP-dependent fatty aldehyde dehydrogenase [Rubripirellula obstinata]|uniref:NADP-dependent fatty aldehyde dehydrogenase n=1 Tax=Rubripirellula obstinata TaxID=406547 RepID=A0A5B1CI55_9BACT|nr:aldehyde dehydrogenase (NADP(+)) [Rubripirellula obstinata]KAA1260828.1 NADP-dependent fatty aldehyde dehydrogenase [Rubripirellula obstinata]
MTLSRFQSYEAATGEPLSGDFCEATVDQIDSACEAAKQAFDVLRNQDENVRADLLLLVADRMQSHREAIVERCQLETGYLQPRVEGEFDRAVGQLKLFARLTRERIWDVTASDPADPDRKPIPKPSMHRRFVPLGPIAVFGACNFPLAISVVGNDFVAAIAVGCPVVVKSHPSHAGTCDLLGRIVEDAVAELGLPAGTFSLLHGQENETSVALVQQSQIAGVGFTGSPAGGRALAKAILDRDQPIPIFAELGSTNPVFLAPDAITKNSDSIADGFASSLRFGNGHMCTKPGVVVAVESLMDPFVKATTEILSKQTPLPLLSKRVAENFDRGIDQLKQTAGVKTIVENQMPGAGPWHRGPHWFSVDAESAIEHDLISLETFGPVSLLVRCKDAEEMLRIAGRFTGSLTTTIHATDQDRNFESEWLKHATRFAGRIIRNGWPTGMEIGPATHHGGPYPASLDGRSTSVGYASLERFIRPVCFQDFLFPES